MKKILVAMSGGVDSSVAALLLQRQGYQVGGATYRLFDGCPEENIKDAKSVCDLLGISHYVLDYRPLFKTGVLDYFVKTYEKGETPNPCIACNRTIKFGAFCQDAEKLGYDLISTGHYAGVEWDQEAQCYYLVRSVQERKDQSYVLYHLNQKQLSMLRLPLDSYEKEQVRKIAAEAGLPVSSKSDSQDICFVPDGDYMGFITRYTNNPPKPGNFVDDQGNVVGQHQGIPRYTIGQSRGLGVALGRRRFVSRLDPVENTVTLSDEEAVFSRELWADDLRLMTGGVLEEPLECEAKIRYAHKPAPAMVYPLGEGKVRVEFRDPQRAITPGQAVVFYQGNKVLGGATIH